VELPLERAVGQASSTLEHGDRLVQHLFKAHSAFSSHAVLSKNVYLRGHVFYTLFRLEKQRAGLVPRQTLFWTPHMESLPYGLH
jgi:hypothetical protein